MSCCINGTTINMTRGDTLRVQVTIYQGDTEEEYTPDANDVIRFALNRKSVGRSGTGPATETPLIRKTVPVDTMILELEPDDTKELAFGSYIYDMEITMADGTVDTFITGGIINLTPEVG